jgi:hypothetical protein
MQYDVRGDMRGVLRSLDVLARDVPDKVVVRAANRTLSNVQTESVKQVRSTYNLRAKTVRGQIELRRARRGRLVASLVVTGRPIPLIEFSASQNRRGVSVKVKSTRKTIRGAFISTMKSGHKGVFARRGKKRLPIDELYSISLPAVYGSKVVARSMDRVVANRFPDHFARELRYYLGTLNG